MQGMRMAFKLFDSIAVGKCLNLNPAPAMCPNNRLNVSVRWPIDKYRVSLVWSERDVFAWLPILFYTPQSAAFDEMKTENISNIMPK